MRRVKQLGSVVFGMNTMFVREEMEDDTVVSEMVMSAGGTHIVYEAAVATPYITLDSKQYGWITEAQCDTLVSMRRALGSTYTLTYDDGSTEAVRFAKERAMVFTPIYEGADKFKAVIPLAKV